MCLKIILFLFRYFQFSGKQEAKSEEKEIIDISADLEEKLDKLNSKVTIQHEQDDEEEEDEDEEVEKEKKENRKIVKQ